MDYIFPKIECIDDVLPAINGCEEFRVIDKGDYKVVNYMVSFEKTWDITDGYAYIRRECRGMIFDKDGKLISRPYHKFFNANERPETNLNKINLYKPHVILEKLDGSMIRPIPTERGFRLATKAGVTEVSMNAEYFIADKPQYGKFIKNCLKNDTTPIFEWVSRKNRIVIDYPEDNLILTAIRNNVDGTYFNYYNLKGIATFCDIPLVKAVEGLSIQNIHLLAEQIRKWDIDGEGIVIRFDDGHMVKIKTDDYVLRHKSKDQISLEKNVLEVILNDMVDDLIPLLCDEDVKRIQDFQIAFWNSVNKICLELDKLYSTGNQLYPEKKDFAVNYVQQQVPKQYQSLMYTMKGGKTSKEALIELIGRSIPSQPKIDENRWMWGNLSWYNT